VTMWQHDATDSCPLEVGRRLEHIRFETVGGHHSWGFSDVTYSARLRWLQELLDLPEGPVPGATEDKEAHARVESTARQLGRLRALTMKGQVPSDLDNLFRSLLLFHNVRCSSVRSVRTIATSSLFQRRRSMSRSPDSQRRLALARQLGYVMFF
jgi:hypothetical protein